MKRHIWLALTLLAINLVIWACARWYYLARFNAEAIWSAQMSLAQGLLLFDTLVIVWVYTVAAQTRRSAQELKSNSRATIISARDKPAGRTKNRLYSRTSIQIRTVEKDTVGT
jgi:hypothetical protein